MLWGSITKNNFHVFEMARLKEAMMQEIVFWKYDDSQWNMTFLEAWIIGKQKAFVVHCLCVVPGGHDVVV